MREAKGSQKTLGRKGLRLFSSQRVRGDEPEGVRKHLLSKKGFPLC